MAISNTRRIQLEQIVRKALGEKATWEFDEDSQVVVNLNVRNGKPGYVEPETVTFTFPGYEALSSCCGFLELNDLSDLQDLSPEGIALFELWLHSLRTAGVVATTATFGEDSPWSVTENILQTAGFKAAIRSVNPNSNNEVTLWFLPVTPSSLAKVGTAPRSQPKKEKPRASRTNNSARPRRR